MRAVAKRYPGDLDAATLFAEALMDTMPWGYWTETGQPKPETVEVIGMLEFVLAHNPDHPGANHYYIHAVEASPNPERGLSSAYRLRYLVPNAGHLVHMPAHIYLRVGQYHRASLANEQAIKADEAYLAQTKAQGFYSTVYYTHNLHFLAFTTALEGRSGTALDAARRLRAALSQEQAHHASMLEALWVTPLFVMARFGQWEGILNEPQPDTGMLYATAMWHYVRGLALAATGQLEDAGKEAAALERIANSAAAQALEIPFLYGKSQFAIAQEILAGELAGRRGQHDELIRHLEKAVQLQDGLPYMEPPYWYYPVRQSLGAALLQAGQPAQAEAVYREDLKQHPDNGWSLFGLLQSLRAQGKAAAEVQKRFEDAWSYADVTLTGSRF